MSPRRLASEPPHSMPKGAWLRIRRIIAPAALAVGIGVFFWPRVIPDAGTFNSVALNAGVLIASFAVFSASVQENWTFFAGLAGLFISGTIVYYGELPAAAIGQHPEWPDIVTAVVSVLFTGVAVLGPGQWHVYRRLSDSANGPQSSEAINRHQR